MPWIRPPSLSVQAAGVPVLVVVLGAADLDVLAPDADGRQPLHDVPVELALLLDGVPVHHQDLDDDQAPPVHAAVARVEDELVGVPGAEDLELVVGGYL